MSEERDQPVAEEGVTPEPVEGVADEANAQGDNTPELDDDGNPIEAAAEDDTEEIEHEGEKYRVPKALKESFLRQADYTRKTQEVAETRRALEARASEVAQQAEVQRATYEDRVRLTVFDQQLEQLDGIDWGARAREVGAEQALAEMSSVNQIKAQRDALAGSITAKEAEFVRSSEQATANALREANEVLSREVQGFGPDLVKQVAQTAETFGFTAQELRESFVGVDGKADTRVFKAFAQLATALAENERLKTTQNKANTAQKVAAVKPATTVRPNAGQFKAGLDDSLPPDEWTRRRNAMLEKQARR